MRNLLLDMVAQSGNLTIGEIVIRIAAATLLSVVIYISYWYTHAGTTYSKKFNVSLVTLTILTCTVMTVIGNNIALSLGMAGALSIVRFRTAVKDSRDTTYIFWAVIVGLCSGVGDFWTAIIGSGVVSVVLLLMGRVRNENRILLIIKAQKSLESDIEGIVFQHFNMKPQLRVKNTTPNSVEFIFEMGRSTYNRAHKGEKNITQLLYEKDGVEYVNVVTQNDEISG
ncbi:MAG: DUF4956 domain-containing protein [Oscillospiraceae bacterium]|nr:DUF4956 domain-containing protein [Oscillospiraceae bacterium]